MRGRGRFRPYMYSVGSTGLSLQIAASKKKPEDGSLLELPTAMARSRLWWFRGTTKTKDPEAGKGRHVKRPVTDQEQLVRLPVACSRLHHPAVQARATADERQQDAGPEATRGKEERRRAERQSETSHLGDGRSRSIMVSRAFGVVTKDTDQRRLCPEGSHQKDAHLRCGRRMEPGTDRHV